MPDEYFSHLDMNGRRVDLAQRPELLKGQVEFEAGREYCVRPPMFPTYLFLLGKRSAEVTSRCLVSVGGLRNAVHGLRGYSEQSG